MAAIKATPTSGLSYAPSEESYWDKSGLDQEIERVFDICHGCRLCFNLCPTFPMLFSAVDANDGDVTKLDGDCIDEIVESCYQCKLCYPKCPYTPDDDHEFQLDFPRLLMRYTAQRARRDGLKFRERMLGNPVRLGRLARLAPAAANWASRNRFHRVIMEKMLGIHRDKKLPEFARETFEKWFKARQVARGRADATSPAPREVVLFHTCFVNYNNPELGKDTVAVLEHNGVTILSPPQTCCGMPALDGGDVGFAKRQASANVQALKPYAERGCKILAINPTCSFMLKKEYADLVDADLRADAQVVADATMDLNEYLFTLKKDETFRRDFQTTPGEVAYHVPCHLKAQNIGFRSRDMMKTIPGAKIRVVDGCCGHDGTWAMKKENFQTSMEVGQPVFSQMAGDCQLATDCPLAAVQIEQATGAKPVHPIQVLARAYESDGFSRSVPPSEDDS